MMVLNAVMIFLIMQGDTASGMGWVKGTFLDCGMENFQGRCSVEAAEYTALLWAVQCTWSLGYRLVEFEGDNTRINRLCLMVSIQTQNFMPIWRT